MAKLRNEKEAVGSVQKQDRKNKMTIFFEPEVVSLFFTPFSVLSFPQKTDLQLKIIFLTNLSKFYAFVQFFQIFVNFFCKLLIKER